MSWSIKSYNMHQAIELQGLAHANHRLPTIVVVAIVTITYIEKVAVPPV